MSSSDRRTFLTLTAAVAVTAGLAACGFSPAYGPGGPAQGLRGKVAPAAPSDRDGFTLVGRIEDRLGPPEAPAYTLDYTIATKDTGVGVTPDGTITRYNLGGTIDYALKEAASGKLVTKGQVSSFTSYSATGTTVATLFAREDAHRRLMTILADQIVTRLIAQAAAQPAGQAAGPAAGQAG